MKRAIIIAAAAILLASGIWSGAQMFAQLFGATSRLPAGYRECEYLESTGTQYIDTGYTPNDATEVVCVWRGSASGRLYGIYDKTHGFTAILGSNGGSAGWVYGSQTANLYFNWSTTYTTRQNSDGVYVNGVLEAEYAAADFTSPGSMYLFAQAGRTPLFTGRIFECSISDDGTLVRDFVPALDSDGTPCLYDLVTATPFYNAGTGTFAYQLKE